MPKTLEQITILVSHTDDMTDHANLVIRKIESISKYVVGEGYSLRATSWKKDRLSGHGTDGQTVLNEEVVASADIVLALFGRRVGSPTARSVSGTAEELYLIKNRTSSPFGKFNAQVFFHDMNVSLSELNIEEFVKLQELHKKLESDGFLKVLYKTEEELLDSVENGIRAALNNYRNPSEDGNTPPIIPYTTEIGLFELQDQITEALQSAIEQMATSKTHMDAFSPKLHEISSRISAETTTSARRSLFDEAANEMSSLATQLNHQGNEISVQFQNAETALFMTLDILRDDMGDSLDQKELIDFARTLDTTADTLSVLVENQDGLRDALISLPRLTTNLNKAKSKLIAAVQQYQTAVLKFMSMSRDAAQKVRAMAQ